MAIIARGGGGGGGGGGGQTRGAGDGEQEVLTNLPPRTGPICGRRDAMQAIVDSFGRAQTERRPGRVEVVAPAGCGGTAVAVELARRAGGRFPGGAWLLRADIGVDLAWADIAAIRGEPRSSDLRDTARRARERLGGEPRALLVVDGLPADSDVTPALPPEGESSADVFLVSDRRTERLDEVVEIPPVPEYAPRRIAHAVLRVREGDEMVPPQVRVKDGLALTASLAARAAVAYHPDGPALSIGSVSEAVMRLVPLVGQVPVALELLLLCGVAHPTLISVDALFGAVAHLRRSRGLEIESDEVGAGVLHLVRLGLLALDEESRVSMHPLVQEVVRGMASSDDDLELARTAFAEGLSAEAEEALGDDGVDVRRASLHQLRHVRDTSSGDVQTKLATVVKSIESALGIGAAG